MEHADLVRLDRLGPVLADALGEPAWTGAEATLIAGGKSNLTFELRSSAGSVVLRRPPTGKLLPKAHDMGREARIQRALADTPVPVAPILYEDTTGDLLGVPFYVMAKVSGHVITGELPPGYAPDEKQRRAIGDGLLDTLVAIHAVVPEKVGLGDFGRTEGFHARQVSRWQKQWAASRTRDVPSVEMLGERLAATAPTGSETTIAHGDYRLGNCLMAPDDPGRVAAVLDWELSTLGDPLTDLALLLFYWPGPGQTSPGAAPAVSQQPGFASRDELVERYARTTGRDLERLDWCSAYVRFKYAVIIQGIVVRVATGAMAGQDFGPLEDEVSRVSAEGLTYL